MSKLTLLKYVTILSVLVLAFAVFRPWVVIESRGLTLTGMNTTGTDFGKPGYFHLILTVVYLLLTFTPRIWAKRLNLLVVSLNLAWAIRNFFIIPACSGGECPVKQLGLWLVLISSVLLLVGGLFPDMKLKAEEGSDKLIS